SKAGSYVEDDACSPINVYGLSKLTGEDAVKDCWSQHLILRTAWLFSAHGSNFLKTVLRLAAEKREIKIVADQRGTPTSTRDLGEAILVAVTALQNGASPWGTYHFAG